MDSRDIKVSAPSLSTPPSRDPSQQSFQFHRPTSLSSLTSNANNLQQPVASQSAAPSTTLLPNAPHLSTHSQSIHSHSLAQSAQLFASQGKPQVRDNMHRPSTGIRSGHASPHSENSPKSQPRGLQPPQVQTLLSASHSRPASSQSLPKLDSFRRSLSRSVIENPDSMRQGHLHRAAPLSSHPTHRYELTSSHQQLSREQHLHTQQHQSFNSSSSQTPLPQIQTRPAATTSPSSEPLPQITLPTASQQMPPTIEAQALRMVHPSIQNLSTRPQISHVQAPSNDPSQNVTRPSSQQRKSGLGSPKQLSRQRARHRSQFGQVHPPVDRHRSLQPRQPPPLPARPPMLASPRGSVVMQDVPRFQRQVAPSVSSHPTPTSQIHDMGSPDHSNQKTSGAMRPGSTKQHVSSMDHHRHSLYHSGMISDPRQMPSVPAMAQQMPTNPALTMSSGQHSCQQHPTFTRGMERRQQSNSAQNQNSSSSFAPDLGKQERTFAGDMPVEVRSTAQRSPRSPSSGVHHRSSDRLGTSGSGEMYHSSSVQVNASNTESPPDGRDQAARAFDLEPIATPTRDERGQTRSVTQRTHGNLLSVSPDSSMPPLQGVQRLHLGINGSPDGATGIQGQPGRGAGRGQVGYSQQGEVAHHARTSTNIRAFITASEVPGIRASSNPLEHQPKLRDEEGLNESSEPVMNQNSVSESFQPTPAISLTGNKFPQSSHHRNMDPSVPGSLNQVMSAQDVERKTFTADETEWKQPIDEKEKPSNSRSSNPSKEEPKAVDRTVWRNDVKQVSGAPMSPQQNQVRTNHIHPATSHAQETGAVTKSVHPNPAAVSRTSRPNMSHSRASTDRHQPPNFVSGPVDGENVPHTGFQEAKITAGASRVPESADVPHLLPLGMGLNDSKKRSAQKHGTGNQGQGTNRSTAAEDNADSQRRQLKVEDALAYLEKVKSQFADQLSVYNQFLDIMKEFKADCIDTNEVIRRVSNLFRGHKDLILGFNTFLPPGYKIQVIENAKTGILNTGFHGPAGVFNLLPPHRKISAKTPGPRSGAKRKGNAVSSPKDKDIKRQLSTPDGQKAQSTSSTGIEQSDRDISIGAMCATAGRPSTQGGLKVAPARRSLPFDGGNAQNSRAMHQTISRVGGTEARAHEFERAIGFVTAIKERFTDSPDTFNEFLDALRRFREEQKSIREVFEAVADLFGPHKDLLSQFKEFIPTIAFSGIQDAKGMKERSPSDFPRRAQGSKVISESTPNKRTAALNGKMKSRHRVREMQFFEDLKAQLGPSKGHLYTEFIKCLSLFSQGIVSREELLHLTGEILHEDHDAHASFLDYLDSVASTGDGIFDGEHQFSSSVSSEGEPTAVDAARIAYYTSKPMSEIAAEAGIEQMHSYRRIPHDFPPCEYSGRSVQEKRTLNDTWINVTTGSEDYSFKFMRRNQNEDNLFRCEDDRYELDLVIETNASTIMKLETIVATISKLPLSEKKRHALAPGALTPVHFNAIRRIYGESGAEVVSQLKMNPSMAVPVVLKRLKEKDVTWRGARMEMNKVWREVGERNFHRSLDHRSVHFKAVDKKDLSTKSLLMDIMDPGASVAARDAEMTRARGYPVENGGGGANHRSQALKAVLAAAQLASDVSSCSLDLKFEAPHIHKAVHQLMIDVVDDEASKKCMAQFGDLIQSFFGVEFREEQTPARDVSSNAESEVAILYGDDTMYIVLRLYHLLFERIGLAFDLAREQIADRERRARLNEEGKRTRTQKGRLAKIETEPWQLTKAMNGHEVDNKFALGPATESLDEMCDMFLALVKQFARGKLDWSRYEDKCRTLLGVDSYGLFTLDKTVQKLIKAIETMFGGDISAKTFVELFNQCQKRRREACTNGGHLDAEGIEVLYSAAAARHLAEARGGGANLMRFQSSCEDSRQCTVLIHVIGETGEDQLLKICSKERAVLNNFLEFCRSNADCRDKGNAREGPGMHVKDDLDVGAGSDTKGRGNAWRKRISGPDDQGSTKRRRAYCDFLRYKLDDEAKIRGRLGSGSLILNNGLEWRIDGSGVLRFVAGKCDFLYNRGRKRAWNEGLDIRAANKDYFRTKRMRSILKLDKCEVRSHPRIAADSGSENLAPVTNLTAMASQTEKERKLPARSMEHTEEDGGSTDVKMKDVDNCEIVLNEKWTKELRDVQNETHQP